MTNTERADTIHEMEFDVEMTEARLTAVRALTRIRGDLESVIGENPGSIITDLVSAEDYEDAMDAINKVIDSLLT